MGEMKMGIAKSESDTKSPTQSFVEYYDNAGQAKLTRLGFRQLPAFRQ